MKIEISELIENVKDELLCYEDAEKLAQKWEEEFLDWLKANGNHKDVVQDKEKMYFKIRDEEDIFEIANSYLDAVEEGSVKQYWTKF